MKWEDAGDGSYFPHIFGRFLPTDVVAALPVIMLHGELQLPNLSQFAVLTSAQRPV